LANSRTYSCFGLAFVLEKLRVLVLKRFAFSVVMVEAGNARVLEVLIAPLKVLRADDVGVLRAGVVQERVESVNEIRLLLLPLIVIFNDGQQADYPALDELEPGDILRWQGALVPEVAVRPAGQLLSQPPPDLGGLADVDRCVSVTYAVNAGNILLRKHVPVLGR
jgi:hypothetical protein